jgi:chromosome segregation ATPase
VAPSDTTPTKGSYPHEGLPTLEARRAQINAEMQAANEKEKALKWEEQYNDVYGKFLTQTGVVNQQNIQLKQLNEAKDEATREMHNREVERDSWNHKYEKELSLATEYNTQLEAIQTENARITEKYQKSLAQNLELSKKLTKANEEYLDAHKQLESTKDALDRTRIEAKKIIRIKA